MFITVYREPHHKLHFLLWVTIKKKCEKHFTEGFWGKHGGRGNSNWSWERSTVKGWVLHSLSWVWSASSFCCKLGAFTACVHEACGQCLWTTGPAFHFKKFLHAVYKTFIHTPILLHCLMANALSMDAAIRSMDFWRRKWQPTPVLLPGESHGQRGLVGLQSMGVQRVRHD